MSPCGHRRAAPCPASADRKCRGGGGRPCEAACAENANPAPPHVLSATHVAGAGAAGTRENERVGGPPPAAGGPRRLRRTSEGDCPSTTRRRCRSGHADL